jgi:putative Mg2+ transporter-C (MgtC) family protein
MLHDLSLAIVGKLLLAALLGGAIGFERGLHRKPAGIRTNMFICLGSAVFTVLSFELAQRFGDPSSTRIVSNLIPGIGFLGAGAILRERGGVVGLTTAATIFMNAGIGMAVGGGAYGMAIFTTFVVLTALTILGLLEDRFGLHGHLVTFQLTTPHPRKAMNAAHDVFKDLKIPVLRYQIRHIGHESVLTYDAEVSFHQEQEILRRLTDMDAAWEILSTPAVQG